MPGLSLNRLSLSGVRHPSPRTLRFLAGVVWLLAILWCVWVVMQWLRPAPEVAPALPSGPSSQYQVDQSAEARLLGVETTGGLTPPAVTLLGVFAGVDGAGAAVMSIEGQAPASRRAGDEVANGWTLDRVEADKVVLTRSGQRHTISMPAPANEASFMQRVPSAP